MKNLNRIWDCASAIALMGIASACWQGDFGKGQSTGSGVWSDPGVNPCVLYPASVAGSGVINPQFKLGMIVDGDLGAEFVFCKLVLAAVTDLLPGQGYFWDKDFTATLMSGVNANNILNAEVGVLNVWGPNTPAGTYYVWLQRAGHASVQAAAASVATGSGESTAVAGQFKFPAAATAAQKSAGPLTAFNASSSITFNGTTAVGSPYITGIASITDLQLGQVITGTGLPANSIIAAIDQVGNGKWRVTIGTNTAGSYQVLQNATAAGTNTFTVTSHVTANVFWPTFNKQN